MASWRRGVKYNLPAFLAQIAEPKMSLVPVRNPESRLVGIVYTVAFLDLFSASMIVTILASYLKDSVGLSATLAGAIGSIYGLVQFFSSPIIGGVCDLKGYRYGLVLTLLFCVPAYALLVFDWWLILAAARLLAGFFKQTQNLCRTFVASFADEKCKIVVFGRLNAMGNVGFICGPALAGYMSQNWGYSSVFLTTSLVFAINSCIVWHFFPGKEYSKPEPHLDSNSNLKPLRSKSGTNLMSLIGQVEWKSQWDLLAVRLLLSFVVLLYRNSFNWYTTGKFKVGAAGIGYLTSYQGFVAFLASYYASDFIKMYTDNVRAFSHVIIALCASLMCLWLSPTLLCYAVFLTPFVFATSIMRVVSLELTTERCHKNDIGLLIGVGASAVSVSRAISPAIGGFLHDLNPEFPTIFGIFVSMFSWYLCVTYTSRNQKHFALTGFQKNGNAPQKKADEIKD